jgi:hypothetical protein
MSISNLRVPDLRRAKCKISTHNEAQQK